MNLRTMGQEKNQNISVSLNHYFETAEETSSPVPKHLQLLPCLNWNARGRKQTANRTSAVDQRQDALAVNHMSHDYDYDYDYDHDIKYITCL